MACSLYRKHWNTYFLFYDREERRTFLRVFNFPPKDQIRKGNSFEKINCTKSSIKDLNFNQSFILICQNIIPIVLSNSYDERYWNLIIIENSFVFVFRVYYERTKPRFVVKFKVHAVFIRIFIMLSLLQWKCTEFNSLNYFLDFLNSYSSKLFNENKILFDCRKIFFLKRY